MNYTVPDNRPFITKGQIHTKVKLSSECKAMNAFIDLHSFTIVDANTEKPIVKVAPKNNEN